MTQYIVGAQQPKGFKAKQQKTDKEVTMEVPMKANFILLALSAVLVISCASRGPASIEEKKDTAHEQYQGTFDRPIQ